MPPLTRAVPDLLRSGPLLDCLISIGSTERRSLAPADRPESPQVRVTAMIDTGSTVSVLSSRIVRELGLSHFGKIEIRTPSVDAAITTRQYEIDLELPNGQLVYDLIVVEAPFGNQEIDLLIGRDVLMHSVLVYLGPENQFTLGF